MKEALGHEIVVVADTNTKEHASIQFRTNLNSGKFFHLSLFIYRGFDCIDDRNVSTQTKCNYTIRAEMIWIGHRRMVNM